TEDRLAGVPRCTVAEDVCAYDRVEAVCAHEEISRDRRRLARDVHRDFGLALLDRRDARVRADGSRSHALRDRGVESRAMHDVSLAAHAPEGFLEVDLVQVVAALVADPKAAKRAGIVVELPRDTDRGEGAHRVRQDTQARTH